MDPEQQSPYLTPSMAQSQMYGQQQQQQTTIMLLNKAEGSYVRGEYKPSLEELQALEAISLQVRGHSFADQKNSGDWGGVKEFAKGAIDNVLLGAPTAFFGMDGPTTVAGARARNAGGIVGDIASIALPLGAAKLFPKAAARVFQGSKAAVAARQATVAARNADTSVKGLGLVTRKLKNAATIGKRDIAVGAVYGGVSGASDVARDENGDLRSGGEILAGGAMGAAIGGTLGGALGAASRKFAKTPAITNQAQLLPQTGTAGATVSPSPQPLGSTANTARASSSANLGNITGKTQSASNVPKPFSKYDDLLAHLNTGSKDPKQALTKKMKKDFFIDVLSQPNSAARTARAEYFMSMPPTRSMYSNEVLANATEKTARLQNVFKPKGSASAPSGAKYQLGPDGEPVLAGASRTVELDTAGNRAITNYRLLEQPDKNVAISKTGMLRTAKFVKLKNLLTNTKMPDANKKQILKEILDEPSGPERGRMISGKLKDITSRKVVSQNIDDVIEKPVAAIKMSAERQKAESLIDKNLSKINERLGMDYSGELPFKDTNRKFLDDYVNQLERLKADPNTTVKKVNEARLTYASRLKRSRRNIKDAPDLIDWSKPGVSPDILGKDPTTRIRLRSR